MDLSRRQLLVACGASLSSPMRVCAAQATRAQFTPETFGAVGDGAADDYDAFVRLTQAVNSARGGSIALAPGRTYLMDRYIAAGNGDPNLSFEDCESLTIEGNGAAIAVKGDFHRDQRSTRSLGGLRFRHCRIVSLRNLELNGNVDRTTRAAGLAEPVSHGLHFQSCSDVIIDGVVVRHFAADGLYIGASTRKGLLGTRQACRRFTVRNSRFLFNARQGLSVIQLRGGLFEDCEFAHTGYLDPNGTRGSYGSHAPSAGVDVEPNYSPFLEPRVDVLTGELMFRRCRMIGNRGAAFVAAKYSRGKRFLERITLESCHLESDTNSTGRYGFFFDVPAGAVLNCTLQMKHKTAYLGWFAQSDASPRFAGNTVYGRNPAANHPIFAVRPTRGAPVIEKNRFIGQLKEPKPAANDGSALVFVDNLNAKVRNNSFFLPAEAFSAASPTGLMPGVFLKAALAEGNTYKTDLRANRRFFAIVYRPATVARNESFRGTNPGRQDTVRPVDGNRGRPWRVDTSYPWSK